MKLRNKKTGEIAKLDVLDNKVYLRLSDNEGRTFKIGFNSLAELEREWEDYEEPNEYYCIDWTEPDGIYKTKREDVRDVFNKEIGNYFNTREEAEKAVEKLKAAKRLKDKGFRFDDWNWKTQCIGYNLDYTDITEEQIEEAEKDLDLLFGGEE